MGRKKKIETPKVKEAKITHTLITCTDCGAMREVKMQDVKQVTRCVECQANRRKLKRKEYRKNRVIRLRTQREGLLDLVKKHEIPQDEVDAVLV